MLRFVTSQIVTGAEIGVCRGEVGIGKSFALSQIEAELENDGVRVIRVTVTPAIEANINAFMRAVLGPNCIETSSGADAMEGVWSLLAGNPFLSWGQRVVLIIDEAQGLSVRVLETIRGLWDRGDRARRGDETAPAFGCLLVGNNSFISRGGAQRVASFKPLLDRLAFNIRLPGPSRAECRSYACTVYPNLPDYQAELAELGEVRGTLRSMATAARNASGLAGDKPVTLAHLRMAIKNMGGK